MGQSEAAPERRKELGEDVNGQNQLVLPTNNTVTGGQYIQWFQLV